jgi:GH15 family glucan-1,4-alpha-glucosidase
MYRIISDYGIIGNLRTTALIGQDGGIDWFCFPYIDSPAVFGALLDDKKGGRFVVQPDDEFDSVTQYVPRTNILTTRFRTRNGLMTLTDFMPVSMGEVDEKEEQHHTLYRLIEVDKGEIDVRVLFEPRFDYARVETGVSGIEHGVRADGGGKSLALVSTEPLNPERDRATALWTLKAGDRACLRLGSTGEQTVCGPQDFRRADFDNALARMRETKDYWRSWLRKSETGRTFPEVRSREMLERSALVLKLLFYGPTGAIAAAATTSLPEEIGGVRNWDYRFTWIRDASFTLQALFNLGHVSETEGYLRWIGSILEQGGGPKNLQIMYGLRGDRDLEEKELNHLDGYKGSRPVRIGNGAAGQRQLDIYGELMDAALKLADYTGKITADQWPILRDICDYVTEHWKGKDSGIWEVRGGPWDFVYSKVMCWVALDRGITIAERYGFDADSDKWRNTMSQIREEILEKGYDKEKQSFVQHYETDALDSSNLLIPLLGFLPFDDAKIVSTVDATMSELSQDGLLYRYRSEDGLKGEEGTFMLCSFWLVECLARMGRIEEAENLVARLERTANHLGLFSEEYDVTWQEALGNFPQAFTHIGYINAMMTLMNAKEKRARAEAPIERARTSGLQDFVRKRLFATHLVLNEGDPRERPNEHQVVLRMKEAMNVLRGAFFDTRRGRVAYEHMKGSDIYRDYVQLARSLRSLDLSILKTREQKIAFWVNLYNVIVIHGVIELDIRDSVKEARRFFQRIRYVVDGMEFTPDDIEHGVLRGNRRPPYALSRVFGRDDPRLRHSLDSVDPRIHFALVCASSSCPPIDVYTEESLDAELTQAGKSFLNGGGLSLYKDDGRVSLSRIFKWYGSDFAHDKSERLRLLAEFLYDPTDRLYLIEHADELRVDYEEYDWRLNRGKGPA